MPFSFFYRRHNQISSQKLYQLRCRNIKNFRRIICLLQKLAGIKRILVRKASRAESFAFSFNFEASVPVRIEVPSIIAKVTG